MLSTFQTPNAAGAKLLSFGLFISTVFMVTDSPYAWSQACANQL
jgi:hypothetical protein